MMLVKTIGSALALTLAATAPAWAQDTMQTGNAMGGNSSMASAGMANGTMPSGMSKSQMAAMKKCQAMSSDMMMKNKKCAAMAKMHPEMMQNGAMSSAPSGS